MAKNDDSPTDGTTDSGKTPQTASGERKLKDIQHINIATSPAERLRIERIPEVYEYKKTPNIVQEEKLWELIRTRTIHFDHYLKFINEIMAYQSGNFRSYTNGTEVRDKWEPKENPNNSDNIISDTWDIIKESDIKVDPIKIPQIPFYSSQAYYILHYATEKYVRAITDSKDDTYDPNPIFSLKNSPYYTLVDKKIGTLAKEDQDQDQEEGALARKTHPVLIELIWSYWQEEGGLAQTMNAISRKFQNIRAGLSDTLSQLDLDPLRPLSNILWGYIQNTHNRLSIPRRAYEYEHHYGISIIGKAIPNFNPAESRSGFIYAFHNLLHKTALFFRDHDDLNRRADAFSVLNALKEVNLLLAEGAHNQFGDLPTTAKVEMLMEQWILSRPEVREFLGGKTMIPHNEPWMERVDAMKNLQGWDKTSVKYYNDLARFGEQLLLGIRNTLWNSINESAVAATWANDWRNEIQGYIHCYQVVTGLDMSADAPEFTKKEFAVKPALLIQKKLVKSLN